MQQLSPGIRICDAYRRLDDPMPYLALKWAGVRRRFSALVHSGSPAIVAQP
jgi:hypothetical protein